MDSNFFMQIVLPYANFIIFVILCFVFFKKPLRKAALAKKEEFDRQLAEANKAQAEARVAIEALEKRLAGFNQEMDQVREGTAKVAKLQAEQIIEQAGALAKNLVAEAQIAVESETLQAVNSLKAMLVKEVKAGIETKIKRDLNPETHDALVKRQSEILRSGFAEGGV